MYLQNKYTIWYYNIVYSAQTRIISEYSEKHHIIPRSLGGNNLESNLVKLTAREHFICHKLLTKMVTSKHKSKMMYAYRALAIIRHPNRPPIKINSKEFEKLRMMGLRKGVVTPDAVKLKISKANKGKSTWNKGIPRTVEERAKMSATRRSRIGTPGHNIRPHCSAEKAEKIKKANLGKRWVHKPVTKERKNIPPEDFAKYCDNGWVPGKGVF
jgi:hypothetical protein